MNALYGVKRTLAVLMRKPGTKNREDQGLIVGRTASFRPPDEAFVKLFNAAIEATGMSRNKLIIAAIRHGLRPAVEATRKERQEGYAEFEKLNA